MRTLRLSLLFIQLICILITFFAEISSQDIESPPKYVLMTPSRLITGTSNRICVSRLGEAVIGQASAQLELTVVHNHQGRQLRSSQRGNKYIARARRVFYEGSGGCIDVLISKTYHKKAVLHFRMRFNSLPQYRVNIHREVDLHHDSNIIMIQTDKPLYRAGETVRFRVLQLRADFTPNQIPIHRISIEAPADIFGGPVKVVQWFNASTQLGLLQREYFIDKYAQQGEWRIVADTRDASVGSVVQTFHVTDYNLPSFYLEVNHDENILITYKQLVWNICTRYMHGEGINGKLDISVSSDSYDSSKIQFSKNISSINPCYNYTLRTQQLGFGKEFLEPPKRIIANIGFQEEGTRIWKNYTAVSYVKKQVVYIEYVDNNNLQYFKSGLPQQIKVRVTDWKNNVVTDAKVQFCKTLNNETDDEIDNLNYAGSILDNKGSLSNLRTEQLMDECDTAMTDLKGIATFIFTVNDQKFIRLKTLILDHPLHEFEVKLDEKRFPSTSLVLKSVESIDRLNMDIGPPTTGNNGLKPGSKHTFPIFLVMSPEDISKPIALHYVLVTRSGILLRWGVIVQCARPLHDPENLQTVFASDDDLNKCPHVDRVDDSSIFKMMIPLKISHTMCPHSYLVAFYQHANGQLIVASKKLTVKECFFNKVSQEWIPKVVAPKESVNLQIKSSGPALCMVSVTNIALKYVDPIEYSKNRINEKLKLFIDSKYDKIIQGETADICFNDDEYSDDLKKYYLNILNSFKNSGLQIVSDIFPQYKNCPGPELNVDNGFVPSPLTFSFQDGYSKERNYFPETWLWNIHVLSSNGSLSITEIVPDEITQWESEIYCLSRSGIAMHLPNDSSMLKVFQPFFIEFSAPRMIKRGEETTMSYKIFNYVDYDIPVSIDLDITPNAAVTISSHELRNNLGRINCIPPKQSIVNYFSIKGHQLKSINVTISAQIQKNLFHLCQKEYGSPPPIPDARDRVTKEIMIEPEGVPIEKHKSALLCIDEHSNKSEISWNIDRVECVEESENWFINMVGDITGPMSLNVENLITMPMGCGEQNMALLAFNVIALEYAIAGKRVPAQMKENGLNNLLTGYQKQLRYRHPDTGAFSAFGPDDESGSTWLTAFCVKYLYIMRKHWGVGTENGIIEKAAQWLLSKQIENGCFMNEGQVFHKEMKGGLGDDTSNIALTAYVIISIIDTDSSILNPSIIQNAAYCLAALKYDENFDRYDKHKIYAFALATLAKVKIEKYNNNLQNHNEVTQNRIMARSKRTILSDSSNDENIYEGNGYLAGGALNALAILKTMAHTNEEMVWWEAGSLSVSIETTGYAILSLLTIGGEENILMAMAAVRWLSLHRNSKGGFLSTQDTLIAMQAIYSLRKSLPDMPPSMNVMIQGPGRGRHFTVTPQERYKLHTVIIKAVDKIDVPEAKLKIKVEGKGCLLVQATQRYNKVQTKNNQVSSFKLFTKVSTDGLFACKDDRCMCAAVLQICVSWLNPSGVSFPDMALMDIQLPTGFSPDKYLLYTLINQNNTLLRRIEESTENLYFYLSLNSKVSISQPTECYNLYFVGPQSNTLPVMITIKDYYHPEDIQTVSYQIPESCPSERNNQTRHTEPVDFPVESDEDMVFQSMHIIDSDYDLEVPKSVEGVPPVYILPPANFDRKSYGRSDPEIQPQSDDSSQSFANWTVIDSDIDLELPDGLEGNKPVWQMPENSSFHFQSQVYQVPENSNSSEW